MASPDYAQSSVLPHNPSPQLLDRIEVTSPYFALRELALLPDSTVTATVDREYDMGLESGVISIAEAGRHLAILGSLAASALQPTAERHFYLATRARVLSFPRRQGPASSRNLRAAAKATLERRAARAEARLALADGTPLFVMTVSYRVMSERIFRRIAPSIPTHAALASGIAAARGDGPVLKLADVQRCGENATRAQLLVEAADCAGHFPGCPALPVAKLMHALALLSGALLGEESDRSGAPTYAPRLAEMEAENLAFSGEQLELRAELERRTPRKAVTRVIATSSSGARIGTGRFTVRPFVSR